MGAPFYAEALVDRLAAIPLIFVAFVLALVGANLGADALYVLAFLSGASGVFLLARASRQVGAKEGDQILTERLVKLEGLVSELQDQVDRDRASLNQLEQERDFLKELYPGTTIETETSRPGD